MSKIRKTWVLDSKLPKADLEKIFRDSFLVKGKELSGFFRNDMFDWEATTIVDPDTGQCVAAVTMVRPPRGASYMVGTKFAIAVEAHGSGRNKASLRLAAFGSPTAFRTVDNGSKMVGHEEVRRRRATSRLLRVPHAHSIALSPHCHSSGSALCMGAAGAGLGG